MFKTDKSAKYALLTLMTFFGAGIPFMYMEESFFEVCLFLGIELIFYWAYLNPWIMQEKYALFFYVDTSKMKNNSFLILGVLTVIGSFFLI